METYNVKAVLDIDVIAKTAVGAVEKVEKELRDITVTIVDCEAHKGRPVDHAALEEVRELLREQVEEERMEAAKVALHCLLGKIDVLETISGLIEYTVKANVIIELVAESEFDAKQEAILFFDIPGRTVYDVTMEDE